MVYLLVWRGSARNTATLDRLPFVQTPTPFVPETVVRNACTDRARRIKAATLRFSRESVLGNYLDSNDEETVAIKTSLGHENGPIEAVRETVGVGI